MDFEKIKILITNKIEDADVEITDLTGTRDHLGLVVSSNQFKGKMLIEQHRMVMDILKESLKEEIHAVKIKTVTKD
ncbi:BolA family transcriptional regulator [Bacteriovoracales bacterium]|nr:BolA family transcriptional regulator [Bacteriovoracales bacterium]